MSGALKGAAVPETVLAGAEAPVREDLQVVDTPEVFSNVLESIQRCRARAGLPLQERIRAEHGIPGLERGSRR